MSLCFCHNFFNIDLFQHRFTDVQYSAVGLNVIIKNPITSQ